MNKASFITEDNYNLQYYKMKTMFIKNAKPIWLELRVVFIELDYQFGNNTYKISGMVSDIIICFNDLF